MRSGFNRSAIVPALAAAFVLSGCGKTPEPAGVAWLASYDKGLAESGKKSRPMMINFYTDW